jgi:nucleotide-binding universal stress UspA family protein
MKALDGKTRIQLKNILFATDFSPAATAALPYAAGLATRFGANLFALHVRSTPIINQVAPPESWPALEKAAEEEEQERRQLLRNSVPGIETTCLTEDGDVWTKLQAVMQREKIDLVVIGTRGRSGIGKLLLGSVAEKIFREAPCPVLTVGPRVAVQPRRDGEFTRILYATSFSSESGAAAPYAVSLAQEYQAKLTLLHVLEDTKVGDLVIPQDLVESSKRCLASLVPPEAEIWCAPELCVECGEAAEKILDVAMNQSMDLIVLGMHRASGIPGADTHLPIATAHKVVSNANCPVLTIRS